MVSPSSSDQEHAPEAGDLSLKARRCTRDLSLKTWERRGGREKGRNRSGKLFTIGNNKIYIYIYIYTCIYIYT